MQIFDIRNLKKICDINWDEENNIFNTNIYCAKFSTQKNKFGICSSNINTFRIYDLIEEKDKGKNVNFNNNNNEDNFFSSKVSLNAGLFDRPLYSMDFSHNGKSVAFAGANNFIGFIDLI
jgi:WD40 repeat protein